MDDRPPFIHDQRMRILVVPPDAKRGARDYIQPESFGAPQPDSSPQEKQANYDSAWQPIARADWCDGVYQERQLLRTLLISESGEGKSIAGEWMAARLMHHDLSLVAIVVEIDQLKQGHGNGNWDLFRNCLALRMLKSLGMSHTGQVASQCQQIGDALRRLARRGKLVLLFDGLDQAGEAAVEVLRELLQAEPLNVAGQECRIQIAGRPFAVAQHWDTLFEPTATTPQHRRWVLGLLEDLDADQQRRLLGEDRYRLVPEEARPILGVPRVLRYLRQVALADFERIRTPSDVFWESTRHMLAEASRKSSSASQSLRTDQALALLAALAFEMLTGRAAPNRSAVCGEAAVDSFLLKVAELMSATPRMRAYDYERVQNDLRKLAEWNAIVGCGFVERDIFVNVQFRDTSLLEFFSAVWLARFATEEHAERMRSRLYLQEEPDSRIWYWVWRYACEFPLATADAEAWATAMAVIYRPGDGTAEGTRRSTEMIYRSHDQQVRYQTLPAEKQGSDASERVAPYQIRCLGPYQGEFQLIVADPRGADAQRIARECLGGFKSIIPNDKGIPATFQMGSPADEPERMDDEQQHPVTLTRPFSLAQYAVKNELYALFDVGHESRQGNYKKLSPEPRCPVIHVSWYDAVSFCLWLGPAYRLPTEAEWEYACRAGTETPFHFGEKLNGLQANCNGNYPYGVKKRGPYVGHTTPVGSYAPNGFELFDMHGNVWEWCSDWHGAYPKESVTDPEGPPSGRSRVLRGGAWGFNAMLCRSANRIRLAPDDRSNLRGFRVVRAY
ncbi:MAG: formylglycine-generating enzyme family protein [Pirellulales bacterium]|nr:formylglycine-generating enzyme family protein [Pirellulales bacterium]